MIIDVHHHFMPREHLTRLDKFILPGDEVKQVRLPDGQVITKIYRNAMPLISISSTRGDIEEQIRDMDAAGVDVAILSVATWMDFLTMQNSLTINDSIGNVVNKHPERFVGFAHVPVGEPGAVDELRRAVRDLGLKGLCITTNFKGVYPDEEVYYPLYEEVSRLRVPIFVHAAGASLDNRAVRKYDMNRNIGRSYDHAVAALRILYSDVLERFPNLRFIHGHLGGTLFAMKERYISETTQRTHAIPKKDYESLLKKHFYFDTAPAYWSNAELMCAVSTLGAENIVMGSDYPIERDWMKTTVSVIDGLDIPQQKKDLMLGGNAASLFALG